MRYPQAFSVAVCLFLFCCSGEKAENKTNIKLSKFSGNYNKTFNDLHDFHIEAARKNGITPLALRADTIKHMKHLVRMPAELELYKTDKLTHSIPYLTTKTSDLFIDICSNFRDSLVSKKLPLYKLILTSVTRTDEDVSNLTKKNFNASHNSAHCYGTTFDISWKRFGKIHPKGQDINTDKLKLVLGEVLSDLHQQERCYIKHERQQACFHITVR